MVIDSSTSWQAKGDQGKTQTGLVGSPCQDTAQDPFSWQSDSIFCKPNYPLLADLQSFFLLDSSD
jgi:hypothetical protein